MPTGRFLQSRERQGGALLSKRRPSDRSRCSSEGPARWRVGRRRRSDPSLAPAGETAGGGAPGSTRAAAVSVLTEEPRFQGKLEYLRQASEIENCPPLLRKDFIKTRPQVKEALDFGASASLLIFHDLEPGPLRDLMAYGVDLELDPLVEVRDPFEMETAMDQKARLIGVNNRNLSTFEGDVNTCFKIARLLESERGFTLIAESGIEDRSLILELQDAGFSAFLIGS